MWLFPLLLTADLDQETNIEIKHGEEHIHMGRNRLLSSTGGGLKCHTASVWNIHWPGGHLQLRPLSPNLAVWQNIKISFHIPQHSIVRITLCTLLPGRPVQSILASLGSIQPIATAFWLTQYYTLGSAKSLIK